ncbi:MAG: DUF4386 domain-containing protein [Silicimonas sp.]|nr:DUF4386 domain-containing protein [Silicimonas sp.]
MLARSAGLAYLVIIVAGISAELALRAPLRALGPEALTSTLVTTPGLFRISLLADLVMISADIALAILFFLLLKPVGPHLSLAVLVLRLMQAAIIAASLIPLTALPDLAAAGEGELAATVLDMHATGYDVGLFFFGLNSVLMWRLLRLSGGVPGLIAAGIGLAGLVYLTGSIIRLAAPEAVPAFEPAYLLPLVAETALCLWLLVKARI